MNQLCPGPPCQDSPVVADGEPPAACWRCRLGWLERLANRGFDALFEEAELRLSFANVGITTTFAEVPLDVVIAMYHTALAEQKQRERELAQQQRALPRMGG